mgnify:CR=1 FL=1
MNYKKITFMVLLAAFMVACEAELPNEETLEAMEEVPAAVESTD